MRAARRRCWFRVTAAALCVALAGCGLFGVREADEPSGPVDVDPLGFTGLLRGTSETFDRLDYNDLFPTDFLYHEGAVRTYVSAEFATRLRAIESAYPSVAIEWTRTNTVVFSRVQGTVADLDSVVYHVYLDGDRSGPADYEGYSGIGLVYRGYWAFLYWYDFPVNTGTESSFFSPDFQAP